MQLESSKIYRRVLYWFHLPKEFILNLKIYEKLVYIMEEVIVNNMEMDDIYEEEQLNQIEMKESEKNNKGDISDLLDNEIKTKGIEMESEQNIKQVKEYRIDFNDKSQKMLLPNNTSEDFLSNIRPITERLNSLSKAIGKLSFSMVKVTEAMNSSAIKWLQKIDFSPLQNVLKSITRGLDLERFKALKQEFLQAMYECYWFPYVGSANSISLMLDVFDILATSRGASKRREKRIDRVIFSYYTNTEIKNIKRRWKSSDLKPHIKKILGQAIEAHLRGEYVLTISCLTSMWENLIYNRAGITTPLQQKYTKEKFKTLSERNGFDEVFSEFYDHLILGYVNSPEDVIEGVPSRNGCLHGHYNKYPNKKASLNAILLTDFIINFQVEEENETVIIQ